MKKFFIFILVLNLVKSCSINPSTKSPTLDDQIKLSGLIVSGKITKIIKSDPNFTSLEIEDLTFYRGNLPKTSKITVKGFSETSLCGSGIPSPDVNKEYIIFLCELNIEGNIEYRVHNIFLGLGYIEKSKENKEAILEGTKNSTDKQECKDFDISSSLFNKIIFMVVLLII